MVGDGGREVEFIVQAHPKCLEEVLYFWEGSAMK
jgi:hypothetical protein